jgi:hypothetical protein
VNPQLRTIQRLLIVMLAGALSITALVTGMAPQVWGILNAHSQIPVQLPDFVGLGQRSVLFDVAGEQIGVFQKENTQKTPVDSVPVVLPLVPWDVASLLRCGLAPRRLRPRDHVLRRREPSSLGIMIPVPEAP